MGDLARMSYQVGSIHYRKDENDLPKHHLRYTPTSPPKEIDILTIGDSFSNGGGVGRNAFYQDYLASSGSYIVLNIQNYSDSNTYVETINSLIENGWLEEVKPNAILIQTVARRLATLYAREQQWEVLSPPDFKQGMSQRAWRDEPPKPPLINTANYKLPYYTLLYHFKTSGQKNVVKLKLTQPMFTVKDSATLLLYKEDIANLHHFNEENIAKINNNFNVLAEKLKKLKISLIFMPAVDKYDLYFDFIANNPFAPNPLFELLEKAPKEYLFINTKRILHNALQVGEKDIFYADDTHWSFKASQLISDEIVQTLNKVEAHE
ncbi:MAG: hypothetical protein IBX45_13890 [Campylobacterales bacterium]|nr:hypothetical protein [Campylobacterales bacterium]